jgi:hypothetical protein
MNLLEISTFPITCSRNVPVRRIMKVSTGSVLMLALLFPNGNKS